MMGLHHCSGIAPAMSLLIMLISWNHSSCIAFVPSCAWGKTMMRTSSISSSVTRNERTQLFSAIQTGKVDISDRAYRNSDYFLEWAGHYGIVAENFQLNSQTSSNWGAEAMYNAAAGSTILCVPSMLRITSQSAREVDFANLALILDQYIDPSENDGNVPLSCHFYLFLKILQEYDMGMDSAYFPWLDAMPRKFSTALNFDNFEMDSCLPPFVKFLAQQDRHHYSMFEQILPQLDTPSISPATKSNPQILQWAFNLVFTRARPAFGEAEIIPMCDMLNHAWDANSEVQYDNEGNAILVLLRDVQQGEALHKCYGQPTNPSRFMSTYGFFDASPPTTYCKFMPSLAFENPQLYDLGFAYDRMVFEVQNGEIMPEVWDVMLYLVLGNNNDIDTQQQFYQACINGDENTKSQIHQQYLPQTCYALRQHVKEVLEEIADCESNMDEGGVGLTHLHVPVIRRHNDFVRQVFTKVKYNLDRMIQ